MKYILASLAFLSSNIAAAPIYQVEFDLGRASQYADSNFSLSETNGNTSSFGVRGLLSVNKYLLVDVAYFDYGEVKNNIESLNLPRSNSVSSTSMQLAVQGRLFISSRFYFGGRVGYSLHRNKIGFTQQGSTFKQTASGENPFVGLGFGYGFKGRYSINFEYTYLETKSNVGGGRYENVIENSSIGLSYAFD